MSSKEIQRNICTAVLKPKNKGGGRRASIYESTTEFGARALRSGARKPQKRVTLRHPRLPAQAGGPGTGATYPHPAQEQVKVGPERAVIRARLPRESGAAPCGRARPRRPDGLGLLQRAAGGERGLGPPPASASAAAGSGCDKLNLRALEKLQEEESEECAEWLKGSLSPGELRPPGPAPP